MLFTRKPRCPHDRLSQITRGVVLGLWSVLAFSNQPTRGDWLYFARGGQVELPAEVDGSMVRVATPDGWMSFPRCVFRSIVPSGRSADDWAQRRHAAESDGSAQALFATAWWALEHGLTPEGTELIRAASHAPGASAHPPLHRASAMLDQLDVPQGDLETEWLSRQLGGSGWIQSSGRHVNLYHQGRAAEAAERLDVLDRVVDSFYLSLAAQGVTDLIVPKSRLISVWFARQADYVSFLRSVEAGPFVDTQGYYHPTCRAVFAFDTRTSPDQIRQREIIARRSRLPGLSAADQADLDRQTLLLDLRWRSIDLGIAAHETVHQLVMASGLATRCDDFPNWLHEGLAAQFEVVRGGQWAGFGRTNDFRMPDWRSIRTAPELGPLLHDDGMTHGYQRERYAEAWALVFFLRKTRPNDYIHFLNRLRAPRSTIEPNASIPAFKSVFGSNWETIARDWRQFINSQQTPLEAHAPRLFLAK